MRTKTSNGPTRSRARTALNAIRGIAVLIAFASAANPQSQSGLGPKHELRFSIAAVVPLPW